MKATGITRRVDDLGRIVLPREIRRQIGISEGTAMEIFVSKDEITLKKLYPENDLNSMAENLMESVGEICVHLGPEKTGSIRQHIREIQNLLKQGN